MGEKRYSIVEVSRKTGLTTSTISNLYNDKVKDNTGKLICRY